MGVAGRRSHFVPGNPGTQLGRLTRCGERGELPREEGKVLGFFHRRTQRGSEIGTRCRYLGIPLQEQTRCVGGAAFWASAWGRGCA